MPVMEHLVELQVRLTRAVIVTAVIFVGTFFYADTLVKWLRIPLQNMFVPGSLSWVPTDLPTVPFVFLAPAEALWQNVKVAGLFALVLATPYILLEVWQFVVPGLHAQERRFVGPFVMLSAVAFYAGVGFSFFFVLPFALNFLISYGVNAGFVPQISIAQYVGFALWFLMVFGLIFEVPLAITLMAKLGWVDAPFLNRYWKWALLGSFIDRRDSDPDSGPVQSMSHGAARCFIFMRSASSVPGSSTRKHGGRTGHCSVVAGRPRSHGAGHVGCRCDGEVPRCRLRRRAGRAAITGNAADPTQGS